MELAKAKHPSFEAHDLASQITDVAGKAARRSAVDVRIADAPQDLRVNEVGLGVWLR